MLGGSASVSNCVREAATTAGSESGSYAATGCKCKKNKICLLCHLGGCVCAHAVICIRCKMKMAFIPYFE